MKWFKIASAILALPSVGAVVYYPIIPDGPDFTGLREFVFFVGCVIPPAAASSLTSIGLAVPVIMRQDYAPLWWLVPQALLLVLLAVAMMTL